MRADGHAALQASSRDQRFWVLYFLIYKCSLIKKKKQRKFIMTNKSQINSCSCKICKGKTERTILVVFPSSSFWIRFLLFWVHGPIALFYGFEGNVFESYLAATPLRFLAVNMAFLLLLCSSGTPWCKSREGKSSATLSVWRILREYLRCAQIMIVNKLI